MTISIDELLRDPTGERELRREALAWWQQVHALLAGHGPDAEDCEHCKVLQEIGVEIDARWERQRARMHERRRYAQCDATCTVDCGACKGAGHPGDAALDRLVQHYGIEVPRYRRRPRPRGRGGRAPR